MTGPELERFLMFAIAVAGKKSDPIWKKIRLLLECECNGQTPFEMLRELDECSCMESTLKNYKLSPYRKLTAAYTAIPSLEPKTCTLEELEAIPGIGPKTARFFLMHSRPNQQYACLDVHILRWLREEWGLATPKSTPPAGKKYRRWEEHFIGIAIRCKLTPAALDTAVWEMYARR